MADLSFDDLIPAKAAPKQEAAPGGVSFDDLVPAKPAANEGEIRNYDPTIREQIAHLIAGDDPFSMRAKIANALVGSTGLGKTGTVNVADFTPVSVPMFAQEAVRSAEEGRPVEATLEAAGAAIPVAGAALRAYAGSAAKALEAAKPAIDAAERSGVALPRGAANPVAVALKDAPIPKIMGGNPIPKKAEAALNQIDAATAEASAANAQPALNGNLALRDWLLKADEAPAATQEAAQAEKAVEAVAPAEIQNAAPGLKSGPDGAFRVITPDNTMEIGARPQVVELSDLKFADGSLQPRDRGRAEYLTDMLDRAKKLDPEQLRPSRVSDSGAPIVMEDGTIISGNGRARSIAQVYSDPALSERAKAYRESLGPEAANMRQPVMVMRSDAMTPEEAAKFADLSNRGRIASMSATERAARDAKALGSDGVSLYQGGDFEAPQNREFLRRFMDGVVTNGERTSVSKEGRLTQEGVQRMRNAVLASAYDDAGILSRMLESSDDNIRNLTGALTDVAPKFANLKAEIKAGNVMPEMDATPDIIDAVKKIASMRNEKISPQEWFDQFDAFDEVSPITKEWIKSFHSEDLARPASRKRMAEVLSAYADEASKHAPGGLFDDPTTTGDVLNVARRGKDGVTSEAEAIAGNQAASDGAGNAAGGAEALGREASGIGEGAIQARGQAGDAAAGAIGDAGKGQARNLSEYLPKPKTPQQIVLEAKRARLGATLGIDGEFAPSQAFDRIFDLAKSGTADDTAKLLKARSVVGPETWNDVSKSVVGRMGLGSDLIAFSKAWEEIPLNGRNAVASSSETRQALDDIVALFKQRGALERLTDTASNRFMKKLGNFPIVGDLLARALSTKTGDAIAHYAAGHASSGGTVATSVAAKAAGAFLMRPASAKATARWISAYKSFASDGSKKNATALALAARMLAKVVADETGDDERTIAANLQIDGGEK